MSVQVFLNRPHPFFTNLDYISGKAVLSLPTETAISSINVKLEGESRTRLAAAKYPHNERSDKKRTEIELHKVLYKVVTVFPGPDIQDNVSPNTFYTLLPGVYEYPFQFRFPFNNDCIDNPLPTNLNMAGIRVEVARDTNQHIRRTLPPSMTGFPGEAEIKYYVKATVVRPQFYKENYRGFADFKFLPIEPPRKKEIDKESYARREHQFKSKIPPQSPQSPQSPQEKKGLFKGSAENELLPRFSVDARLPSPPIITCNEPLPLRILIKKLNDSSEIVTLQLLQIELISYTHVRAQDLTRTESGSWVITTRSNIGLPLGSSNDRAGKEWKLDAEMWNHIPLPSSILPSFETCNLSRTYELEIRVGLAHGPVGSKKGLIVLPLRMAVQVYSGIAPPQALLDAMNGQPSKGPIPAPVQTPVFGFGPGPSHIPPSQPMAGPGPGPSPIPMNPNIPPPQPPRPSPANHPVLMENFEEAPPPSYEDAMADALAPVDGPRHEYNPLAASQRSSSWTSTDAQSSAPPGNPRSNSFGPSGSGGYDINSKSDERLFPSEAGSRSPMFEFTSIPPVTVERDVNQPSHPASTTETDGPENSSLRMQKQMREFQHYQITGQQDGVSESSTTSTTDLPSMTSSSTVSLPIDRPPPQSRRITPAIPNLGIPPRKPVPAPKKMNSLP
ncbi:hypothetical protein TESG_07472 [Trichophyton tonsurans CBS 112818]|uniref:Arrestin-like N-terminal domain-containing protein n=1 Tax=Trichophyton tonsurans (strain CBS 112818) TaxID=647933 RepID=F2S9A1_TRIT1|nr:hypothetical protein TESG_07472 [Trichophyton tonsurans CBS 112818]